LLHLLREGRMGTRTREEGHLPLLSGRGKRREELVVPFLIWPAGLSVHCFEHLLALAVDVNMGGGGKGGREGEVEGDFRPPPCRCLFFKCYF